MDIREIEYRIKRLESAMIDIAVWGFRQGLRLGICMNSAADRVPPPHWQPAPHIDWSMNIINLPGVYNKENYPDDFQGE